MNDHTELRRLAEAATKGEWGTDAGGPLSGYGQRASIGVFSNDRLDAALDDGADEDTAMSDAWLLGIWGGISEEDRANAAFIAAANPSVVLSLIAEVERLQDEMETIKSEAAGHKTSTLYIDGVNVALANIEAHARTALGDTNG